MSIPPINTIICGDCLEVMRGWPDNCVDAVVTDPPYELGFMGKQWDSTGVAYRVEVWADVLRVLKPGGHLLAFGGTRTYHRMACAIEDAGFEIRDQMQWLYGSGFPKSLDIGKAIDKSDAGAIQRARQLRVTTWLRTTGLTGAQIDAITETCMGGHYLSDKSQPAVPTRQYFEMLRPHITIAVPQWVEDEIDLRTIESENMKRREVVGTKISAIANPDEGPRHTIGASRAVDVDITAPATNAAKRWSGWGTALKPANEPVCVARKPLSEKTVAANVLKWGTGGLNIDGGRIDTPVLSSERRTSKPGGGRGGIFMPDGNMPRGERHNPSGRWPANVVLDEEAAAMLDEQSGESKSAPLRKEGGKGILGGNRCFAQDEYTRNMGRTEWRGHADSGGASRFFYCAKASRAERERGLSGNGRQNNHPTVKPLALMGYLVRLVAPPGGVILDPFCGSGTTCVAAKREGFDHIGIDISTEYCEIARQRIAATEKNLFAKAAAQ